MNRSFYFLIFCAAFTSGIPSFSAEDNFEPLAIGSPAPDFSLPGVDGKMYALKDFAKANVLAVIFTCNHCPTAQAYEERIKRMVAEYTPKGVAFVAISPNDPLAVRLDELGYTDLGDSFEDMKIRAKDHQFNFPYLYDGETQAVTKKYGPTATPHVFLFDKERKLRYRGRIDNNERNESRITERDTQDTLDALLAGKHTPYETTKPFGCSIKWASKRNGVKDYFVKVDAEEVAVKSIDAAGIKELIANKTDKYRLVNVWATWCGPCTVEFPDLVTINRMYRNRPFEFVSISADDPGQGETVLKFLKKEHASNANYHFNSSDKDALVEAIDPKWQANLPYTLLIKPGGEIIFRQAGSIDPLELKRQIVEKIGRTYAAE